MTNDEKIGWTKINIRQSVDDLIKYGPSIEIDIVCVATGAGVRALAQLDTGAHGTGVSARLANKLALLPHGAWGEIHEAGRDPIIAPYHLVRLVFPHCDVELEVAQLPSLGEPHDVLIGRDIFAKCRLGVDFTEGLTTLLMKS